MNPNRFKPMLAAAADAEIRYPVLLSPKLDGIRCLIIDGVAVGRSLKPIPNHHVQRTFGHAKFNGLDGELIVGDPTAKDVFQKTTSGVMSMDGKPEVRFWTFDDFSCPGGFYNRLKKMEYRVTPQEFCNSVAHHLVKNEESLNSYEVAYTEQGFEGVMLRDPEGRYKHGRSTSKEGGLLKVKRFTDSEALVVDVTEAQSNTNEAVRNALGQLERSSHKSGKVGKQMLGSLIVRDLITQTEFEIGTGFTAVERQVLWAQQKRLVGQVVKYKHQKSGEKDKPRFPVFLGFRNGVDIS